MPVFQVEGPKLTRGAGACTYLRWYATRWSSRCSRTTIEPCISNPLVNTIVQTCRRDDKPINNIRNGQVPAPDYILDVAAAPPPIPLPPPPPPPPPPLTFTIVGFVFLLRTNHLTRSRDATESSTDECPFEPPPTWIDLPRCSFVL
jgi:hypothetical protein